MLVDGRIRYLNTLNADGEMFESGKKKVADSKVFGYVCGRGLIKKKHSENTESCCT